MRIWNPISYRGGNQTRTGAPMRPQCPRLARPENHPHHFRLIPSELYTLASSCVRIQNPHLFQLEMATDCFGIYWDHFGIILDTPICWNIPFAKQTLQKQTSTRRQLRSPNRHNGDMWKRSTLNPQNSGPVDLQHRWMHQFWRSMRSAWVLLFVSAVIINNV